MALNQNFRKIIPASLPQVTATYSYFDVAEGTGIQNFYAGNAGLSSSGAKKQDMVKSFLTSDDTTYSNRIAEKAITTTNEVWDIVSNVNYEVTFNLPKVIKGQARCTFSYGGIAGANSMDTMVETSLYHYDGTTPTVMASGAVPYLNITSGTSGATVTLPLDLTTQKWKFKKGDILRLNMKLWASGSVANAYCGYGCDPQDRDDVADASGSIILPATNTTILKIGVPFVIEV